MQELIYTSSPHGLKTGTSGFCSVAWTRGISVPLIEPLENLSGYKPLYLPGDPRCVRNPVVFACQKVRYGSLCFTAVSRIADAGLDYTARSNKIAHHIVPEKGDPLSESPYGPAGLLLVPENFCTAWQGAPRLLEPRIPKCPPAPPDPPSPTWLKYKGDARFAEIAARRTAQLMRLAPGDPAAALFLAYPPEMPSSDVLRMIAELLLLLPPSLRGQCTFNTYFIQQQIGVDCLLRAAPAESPLIAAMRRLAPDRVIDLAGEEPFPENGTAAAPAGTVPRTDPSDSPHPTIRLTLEAPREIRFDPPQNAPVPPNRTEPPPEPSPEPESPVARKDHEGFLRRSALGIAVVLAAGLLIWMLVRFNAAPVRPPAKVTSRMEIPSRKAPVVQREKLSVPSLPIPEEPEDKADVHPAELPPQMPGPAAAEPSAAPAVQKEQKTPSAPPQQMKPAPSVPKSIKRNAVRVELQPGTWVWDDTSMPELSPEEKKILASCREKYTPELRALRKEIESWNTRRERWFRLEKERQAAQKAWRNALSENGIDEQKILPSGEFQDRLDARLRKLRPVKMKKRKERLHEELQDWVARTFPPIAAKEKDWEKTFADAEKKMAPPAPGKEDSAAEPPPRPEWLQEVYDDAQDKHRKLYPLFVKQQDAERKEKEARNSLQNTGKKLLAQPLVGSCGLKKSMTESVENRKPVNLQESRKKVSEFLSEMLARALKQ